MVYRMRPIIRSQIYMIAPIALFTFNRIEHTRITVDALRKNVLATETDIIVFSDGAKTSDGWLAVNEVRQYLSQIQGFRSVKIVHRNQNYGLSESITRGVEEILIDYERIIVVEDDLLTSPHFLTYMNAALDKFSHDSRVVSIHAYVYPVQENAPAAFFLPGADCWGWATWRRGWKVYNSDGRYLLGELKRRKLCKEFDYNNSYPYSKMLKAQIRGDNDSWAIRWYASAFLAGKLTLYPGRSLVHNLGNDGSGTHSENVDALDVELSEGEINLNKLVVESSIEARSSFEDFFRRARPRFFRRVRGRVFTFIKGRK